MHKTSRVILVICGVMLSCAVGPAVAAEIAYPSRPIRIVDPFPPGGPSDIVARSISPRLGEALGQTVVVDNRGGAAGVVGCEIVAKAAPDGHTLLLGPSGALTIQPTLSSKLPYDPRRDFEPVTQLTSGPQVIAVNPSVPARSIPELIALAKAKPGQLNYASGGAGTANHLAAEVFKLASVVNIVHVPYKGTGPALASVISGETQMIISSLLPALPHVKSGKLRALAVTSTSRSAAVPDVPTAAESGLPKFETSSWHGILVPARTPRAIVTRLHDEVVKVLNLPDVRERLTAQGLNVVASTPQAFAGHIKSETEKYARVIKQVGIKPEA
ncbi:MAG TPA: tripartite tricarboxylate transporter substrate binding protein [Burkholderiales bacterium]|nr:tripartite tricarboxylate transporter substrate binding protein [Burkholderiales bacterium]